jgi:rhodanese-related sulfurtransferase
LCWAGHKIVHWGIGEDEEDLEPGVVVLDVDTGEEYEIPEIPKGKLFFQEGDHDDGGGILFCIGDKKEDGLTAWNIHTPEFLSKADATYSTDRYLTYHPTSKTFLAASSSIDHNADTFTILTFKATP